MRKFDLYFVCHETEFMTPLVASQIFEQAEIQHKQNHQNGIGKIKVLIPISLRNFWDPGFRNYKKILQKRFPNLFIHLIPGLGRLNYFPRKKQIQNLRKSSQSPKVLWHFRGDTSIAEFAFIKAFFPQDKFIVDIRGIWPAEKLLELGTEVMEVAELYQHEISERLIVELKENLILADAICSVSPKLLSWTLALLKGKKQGWIVPCSTKVSQRELKYFEEYQQGFEFLKDRWTIGYLGGTAAYQNLDELVLPFMKTMTELEDKVFLLFITHQKEALLQKLVKAGIDDAKFAIVSAPQDKVVDYARMFDIGLLIRRYNLVNAMAQPVKLGEYLAASVPVLLEKKLGGVLALEIEVPSLLRISFQNGDFNQEAVCCLDFLNNTSRRQRKENALSLASDYFSWENNVKVHYQNYLTLL